MSHSHKTKTRAPGSKAALLVLVTLAAGGMASIWVALDPARKQKGPAATAMVSDSNLPMALTTNRDASSLSAWLLMQTNAGDMLNLGTTLLEEGRLNESVLHYRRALELNADDEETHFNLGVAYARLGELDQAARHYQEALRIYPDYTEAHNNLGNVLTRQKRFGKAIEAFQAALKISPDNAMAHNNLGRVLAQQGNPAEAVTHFAEATRLDTNYLEARFNLGAAYLTMGRTNEALTEFQATLQMRPGFAPALQILSRLRPNQP